MLQAESDRRRQNFIDHCAESVSDVQGHKFEKQVQGIGR
jgi:hypothetical protein